MPGPATPYEPGNRAAVTHGAYSLALLAVDADEIISEVADENPPWIGNVDRAALEAWAFTEATVRRLRVFIAEEGALDAKGKPRPAADLLLRFERQAERARAALGFDPTSRARLGRDTAVARAMSDHQLGGVIEQGKALRLRALGTGDGAA